MDEYEEMDEGEDEGEADEGEEEEPLPLANEPFNAVVRGGMGTTAAMRREMAAWKAKAEEAEKQAEAAKRQADATERQNRELAAKVATQKVKLIAYGEPNSLDIEESD